MGLILLFIPQPTYWRAWIIYWWSDCYGGNFDWESAGDRFEMLNSPDPSYHGAICLRQLNLWSDCLHFKSQSDSSKRLWFIYEPFNAFTFVQGLETLPLRMQRHCENAEKVAEYLSSHNKIQKEYPSLSGVHVIDVTITCLEDQVPYWDLS